MLCSGLSTVFKQRSERLSGTQANQVVTDLEETPQKTETETFWSISLKYMAVALYFLMILIWDKRLQSSILDFLGLLP